MDARPCRTSMRRSLFTAEYDTDRTSAVLGITACIPNEQLVVAGRHAVYNSAAASSAGGDEVLLASSATEAARKNIFLKFMCAASFTLLYPHYNCKCK